MDYVIQQHIQTLNDCYKEGKKIVPKGIIVHSTACRGVLANPRFVQGWNRSGIRKCVHAFVDLNGIYQTLPWNHRGWHAGGIANNTHIGFEIAEPSSYKDKLAFKSLFDKAVWLCAFLCKKYNLTEKDILCHSEAHKLGIASNHADVMHWFPQCGSSMDMFRKAVGEILHSSGDVPVPTPVPVVPVLKRIMKLDKPYMTGEDIKKLQQQLTQKGNVCKVDGIFGKLTEAAVKAFQKAHKLDDDGIVGKLTWNELFK